METFYGLGSLRMKPGEKGGSPTVFNAANERAVAMFLEDRSHILRFREIIWRVWKIIKILQIRQWKRY